MKQVPSIAQIAADILREVDAERQTKVAAAQLAGPTASPVPHSEVARGLNKIAHRLRELPTEPVVTMTDIHNFMGRVG
jgi:hypothetical protein